MPQGSRSGFAPASVRSALGLCHMLCPRFRAHEPDAPFPDCHAGHGGCVLARSGWSICASTASAARSTLIINKPTDISPGGPVRKVDLTLGRADLTHQPVFLGGPVQTERGFVLHDPMRGTPQEHRRQTRTKTIRPGASTMSDSRWPGDDHLQGCAGSAVARVPAAARRWSRWATRPGARAAGIRAGREQLAHRGRRRCHHLRHARRKRRRGPGLLGLQSWMLSRDGGPWHERRCPLRAPPFSRISSQLSGLRFRTQAHRSRRWATAHAAHAAPPYRPPSRPRGSDARPAGGHARVRNGSPTRW